MQSRPRTTQAATVTRTSRAVDSNRTWSHQHRKDTESQEQGTRHQSIVKCTDIEIDEHGSGNHIKIPDHHHSMENCIGIVSDEHGSHLQGHEHGSTTTNAEHGENRQNNQTCIGAENDENSNHTMSHQDLGTMTMKIQSKA